MAKSKYTSMLWVLLILSCMAMLIAQFLPVSKKDLPTLSLIFFGAFFICLIVVIRLIRTR